MCLVGDTDNGNLGRQPNKSYKIGLELSGLSDEWCLWYTVNGDEPKTARCGANSKIGDSQGSWNGCQSKTVAPSEPNTDTQIRLRRRKNIEHVSGITDTVNRLPKYPNGGVCTPSSLSVFDSNGDEQTNPIFLQKVVGNVTKVIIQTPRVNYPGGKPDTTIGAQYAFGSDLVVIFYLQNGGIDFGQNVQDPKFPASMVQPPVTTAFIVIPEFGAPYGSAEVTTQLNATKLNTCDSDLDCPAPLICNGPTSKSTKGRVDGNYKVCLNPHCRSSRDCNYHGTCSSVGLCICDPKYRDRLDCSFWLDGEDPDSPDRKKKSRLWIFIAIGIGAALLLSVFVIFVLRRKIKGQVSALQKAGYNVKQVENAVTEQSDLAGNQ